MCGFSWSPVPRQQALAILRQDARGHLHIRHDLFIFIVITAPATLFFRLNRNKRVPRTVVIIVLVQLLSTSVQ